MGKLNDRPGGQVVTVEPVRVSTANPPRIYDPLAGEAPENFADTFLRIAIEYAMKLAGAESRLVAGEHGENVTVSHGSLDPAARAGAGQPVGNVARHVGYESSSAFVAAFRRATGMTPAAYFRRVPEPPLVIRDDVP